MDNTTLRARAKDAINFTIVECMAAGFINKEGIKVQSVCMPEKPKTYNQWMNKIYKSL